MLELASERDFHEINRIAGQVHDLHIEWRPDLYCQTSALFSREYLCECVSRRSVFVAKLNSCVVGYLLFDIWESKGAGSVPRKILQLDSIGVDESFRGKGIGSQMMMELRALAKAFRCTDIQLSVYPQNDDAVAFYQKCGFTIRNINMQTKV